MENRKPVALPKIWAGATVYIIGGGPSLNDCDLTLIHDKRVIGVNQAFRLGSWVDVLYFGDCSFYKDNIKDIRAFAGLKISSCGRIPVQGWPGVLRLKRKKPRGIETRPNSVSWNGNSGASAISIAAHLGAKRIVLVGFDMRKVEEKHHWHSHYKDRGKTWDPYIVHMKGWPTIAQDAKKIGIEIINATPGSAITEFPFMPLEDTL